MTIHKTLDAAREAAKALDGVVSIIEIDHAIEGRCYIGCKASMAMLARSLRHKPMPEITRLVAEHSVSTPQEITARADAKRKQVTIYLSSRGWGDYSPVEWHGDITRADAEIMAECRDRLARGHDVDTPNPSDADLLAKIHAAREKWQERPMREAEMRSAEERRRASGYCYHCESWCHGDCGYYSNDPAVAERRELQEAAREQAYGMEGY